MSLPSPLSPMKVLPFNAYNLKEAVDVLKSGGIVAHPADTCFGLTGDVMNPEAYKKIQAIKGREHKKPMSIMISVPEQLNIKKYVKLDDFSSFVAHKLFPSPVTLVLPKGSAIPKHYFPDTDTVGLRVPLHDQTEDMLMAFGGPLITTSANRSGTPLCFTHEEVVENFKNSKNQPDLVFKGKLTKHNQASTVIKVEKDHISVERRGPVTASQLQSILGVPVKE